MPNSQNVQAYLQDINFHLEMQPNVTDKDKLFLLRTTSSPEVRSFLDRQPANTKTEYQLLQKALIKEFANPESDQGLVAALEMRLERHKPPQAYNSRLRQAYFGTCKELDMEKSNQIKSLLLSHHHSTSALVSEILMSVLQTVQKNNRQFTYGQTVQKNNKQFTYGQTVQKTALEHLQCSRQCKKTTTAIYIWTDSAKKQQQFTYGQYIFTDCTEDNVQNTHTYTQYT